MDQKDALYCKEDFSEEDGILASELETTYDAITVVVCEFKIYILKKLSSAKLQKYVVYL